MERLSNSVAPPALLYRSTDECADLDRRTGRRGHQMGRTTGSTRVARRGRDVERVAVLPVCEVDGDDVSQMGAGHGLAEEVRIHGSGIGTPIGLSTPGGTFRAHLYSKGRVGLRGGSSRYVWWVHGRIRDGGCVGRNRLLLSYGRMEFGWMPRAVASQPPIGSLRLVTHRSLLHMVRFPAPEWIRSSIHRQSPWWS